MAVRNDGRENKLLRMPRHPIFCGHVMFCPATRIFVVGIRTHTVSVPGCVHVYRFTRECQTTSLQAGDDGNTLRVPVRSDASS